MTDRRKQIHILVVKECHAQIIESWNENDKVYVLLPHQLYQFMYLPSNPLKKTKLMLNASEDSLIPPTFSVLHTDLQTFEPNA